MLHIASIFSLLIIQSNNSKTILQHVKQIFTSCGDLLRKKQFCYILARHVSFKKSKDAELSYFTDGYKVPF